MGLVKLGNIHFHTDEIRPDDLSELELLMGIVRYYFSTLECVREGIIKRKCSDPMGIDEGFIGATLNGLEQIDLEKLEKEVQGLSKEEKDQP